MDPAERYRLPLEIYRLIVSELTDRRDVFPLITVSRAFNYEAERVLYRKISLDPRNYRYRKFPLQSKSSRQRSGCHLHSLAVALFGYSNLVVQILKSAPNLKSLSFHYHYSAEKFITLPKKPPFQLLKLETNGPADSGLKAFLETQRELTTLIWGSPLDLDLCFPMVFLPSLTNISSYGSRIIVIHGSGVKRVQYRSTVRDLEDALGSDVSVESVRSLSIRCDFDDISSLSNIFPNLEYLDGLRFSVIPDNNEFRNFPDLRKLKMTWIPYGPYDDKCALLAAAQLFRRQTTLQSLEIINVLTGKVWTMQQGEEPTVVARCQLVQDEWMTW